MSRARLAPGLALLAVLLVWALADNGHAQRPPPGSPGATFADIKTNTPAIGGTVVEGVTGVPIPGAVVSIGSSGLLAPRQATDEGGRFLFSNLSIRIGYELTATKPGYYDGAVGRDTWNGMARRIVLTKSTWVSDARIALFRPGAISGRVFDVTGQPVAGVRVATLARIRVAGELRLATGPTSRTDRDGAYRIAPLPPGSYLVLVPSVQTSVPGDAPAESRVAVLSDHHPGALRRVVPLPQDALAAGGHHLFIDHAQPPLLPPRADGVRQGYVTTFHPDVRDLAAARMITLGMSEERLDVDVSLRPVPVFTVSGTVSGTTAGDRHLTLRLLPRGSESMGLGHEVAITAVNADGRFMFFNVPDGLYTIVAGRTAAGFVHTPPGARVEPMALLPGAASTSRFPVTAASDVTQLELSATNGPTSFGRHALVVAGRNVAGVSVPLQPGAAIRGRIVLDDSVGVRGATPLVTSTEGLAPSGLLGRDGPPSIASLLELAARPRVAVSAEPADASPVLSLAPVWADGETFEINGLQSGEYLLRTSLTRVKSVLWKDQDYTERPLPVGAGAQLSGVVITLDRSRVLAGGTVRDEQGRDALDGTVLCFPTDPARWERNGFRPAGLLALPVGRAGAYRTSLLPPGDYYFLAVPGQLPDTWRDPAFLGRAARIATKVTLEEGASRLPNLLLTALP
jgi:hypothetical protein